MKRLVSALATFAALALAATAQAAPNWQPIQSIFYTGGSFGGTVTNNITLLGGAQVTQIGVHAPLGCGLSFVNARVFAIQPAVVAPTRLTATYAENGYGKYVFSVNGGLGAFLSGVQIQLTGAPGSFCQADVYVANDNIFGGGNGGGGAAQVSGFDFNGFRTCQGLLPNHACTLQANPVTDACLAVGGQDSFCGDCSVLCNLPIN